jgi:tetratricopeptide (TPR) repeat protein
MHMAPARADDDTPDLVATVPTAKPRTELSEFLIAPAQKAAEAGDLAHAIPLYQALVVARGPGSPEAKQLAQLYADAKLNDDASAAWTAYAEATKADDERTAALTAASQLAALSQQSQQLALVPDLAGAKRAFALGRAAFAKQLYGDALVDYQMGYALAPELAGFLRELGATYDKLGAASQKREFYRRYLVQRPFGPNADAIRGELSKEKGLLGTLQISTSMPCTELWLNRQRVPGKVPASGLVVAPGSYKGLCFVPKYEMALFEYATVAPGKPSTMAFRWAIVVNQLDHPLGRIALENAKSPGMMIDLGITSPEVGVAVPAEPHKLRMVLKDDTGTRTEERSVQLDAGQRLVVQW